MCVSLCMLSEWRYDCPHLFAQVESQTKSLIVIIDTSIGQD